MIDEIAHALKCAEISGRALEVTGLQGLSGDRLIGALQRFAALGGPDRCYVEIGVYRGLTLLSVAKALPDVAVFGIDNFSQFDLDRTNRSLLEARIAADRLSNVHLLDDDFECVLPKLHEHLGARRRVGTLFVDGPHDYRSQLMCLELIRPYLAEFAVIVVDDSNYLHVRQANRDFLTIHRDYKLLFDAYTRCHPENMRPDERAAARHGWWNGVNILVHDPNEILEPAFPPVDPERTAFINDHVVHGSSVAPYSDIAVDAVASLFALRPIRALTGILRIARRRLKRDRASEGNYVAANTFSADLPTRRLNPRIEPPISHT